MKKKFFMALILILMFFAVSIYLFTGFSIRKKTNTEKMLECKDCNVMIISLTNVRKDHVSLYGYSRKTTPSIDEFFKNSLIFNNAFAPASWTLPVAASLYSSLFPYAHGVMNRNKGSRLSDDILTFPEILKKNGYTTAAFTGDGDYNRQFNLNQGFDFYLDSDNYQDFGNSITMNLGRGKMTYSPVKAILPVAKNWLKDNSEKKFFFLLQGYDAHCPFAPEGSNRDQFTDGLESQVDFSVCQWTDDVSEPVYKDGKKYYQVNITDKTNDKKNKIISTFLSEDDIKYMSALYDGAINEIDYYLADFFQQIKDLGLEKNTIFIFMAEHGDLFGDHGRFMRGGQQKGTFYDPVINFPIVIKHPKIKEPIIINDLVQTVDIMPTLLNILGLKDPESKNRQGKNLSLSVFGDNETNEYTFSATTFSGVQNMYFTGTAEIESIRDKEWKLTQEFDIDSKTFESEYGENNSEFHELYNVKKDSQELNNLYESRPDIAGFLEEKLNDWSKTIKKYE